MRPDLLKRYAAPVPRYTSYPTAPHFSPAIDAGTYERWLSDLGEGELSLYVHIPFCKELCWYCGCSTKITRKHAPIARYLEPLTREITTVAGRVGAGRRVTHLHWGGGSPSILPAADILRLASALKAAFAFDDQAEFAVEIDPRGLTEDQIAAFAQAGVNRVSIGVQDFAPAVQAAINRMQSFDTTKWVVDTFRAHGVEGINVDLVYGLPQQTVASLDETMSRVIEIAPDRIALFGYAHLPQRIVHQRLIDEAVLPGTEDRFHQATLAADRLVRAGFTQIGLDHYARPGDPMASGDIRRNFQGYTTDDADVLIGLGASSIGRLPQGYVQNAPAIGDYERRVMDCGLATVRGHAMSEDDEARGFVIERLMCEFEFPAEELRQRFGATAEPILEIANRIRATDEEGLTEPSNDGDGFVVTGEGRLFVRSICARFDAYLGRGTAQHSAGV